ncbi:hypothetical protein TIFTF001_025271 [Ficus carica]|uniref:Uncharacterized protein n=1 Tax=Ficus carica TaxID=3494 RepID=A0AA88B198_FICCA|nr:hypothetical protein TIFTF001_025271 [Ficus carica]
MLGLKRITSRSSILASQFSRLKENNKKELLYEIPLSHHFLPQWTSNRFLDIYQLGNKKAIEKERSRLVDEMNRGYFADISELKQHGGKTLRNVTVVTFNRRITARATPGNASPSPSPKGPLSPPKRKRDKIAMATKIIIPALEAVKFPSIEVNFSDGKLLKLPIEPMRNENTDDADRSPVPKVSLLCLSFRANSQSMIDSWSLPFLDAYGSSKDIHLYEISFIDSWLLCRSPIKRLFLQIMKKSKDNGRSDTVKKQIAYSFGDHYYFRKELKLLNLLTGYIFLLDKFGRIRWQGFGLATQEEVASLLSCTSLLLEESEQKQKLFWRPETLLTDHPNIFRKLLDLVLMAFGKCMDWKMVYHLVFAATVSLLARLDWEFLPQGTGFCDGKQGKK